MTKKITRGPLLDHLDEIESLCEKGEPSINELVKIFGAEGHYVLMTFLIIPFLQPVPLLGLSTPFGILIGIVSALAYFQKPPWVPRSWGQKKISTKTVLFVAENSERVFEKLTPILHPRFRFFFMNPWRTLSMILLVLNAILLSLPLPIPFSNALPAWMIAFQTLAHLERDGLFIALSYIQSAICIAYFVALYFGLSNGLDFI